MFYDSVYEHPDRPPDHIVENDDLIDKWYEDKIKEMEQKQRDSYRKSGGSISAYGHEEVIVFNQQEEYEEDEDEEL